MRQRTIKTLKSVIIGGVTATIILGGVTVFNLAPRILAPNAPETNYPKYGEIYGIDSGDIVQLNLTDTSFKQVTKYGSVKEGAATENYIAWVDDKSLGTSEEAGIENAPQKLLAQNKKGESSPKEITLIDQQIPNPRSMQGVQNDKLVYLLQQTEDIEDSESHAGHNHEGGGDAHESYYNTLNVADLSTNKTVTIEDPKTSEPLRVRGYDATPDREKLILNTITGDVYTYSVNDGTLTQEQLTKVDKIGWMNNHLLWYTKEPGSKGVGSESIHTYDTKTSTDTDLASISPDFTQISVLSFKQVNNQYILIGNSYKNGSPKQIVFYTDMKFSKLNGVVNLSDLNMNSNSSIWPIQGTKYIIDVRGVKDPTTAVSFKIQNEPKSVATYDGIGLLFGYK